jgi:lipopolysaccharide/colanic/teichoic acid biosynthesis glycosyltransferase
MKNQSELPSSAVLSFPQITSITRFLPPENDEHPMPEPSTLQAQETLQAAKPHAKARAPSLPLPMHHFARQLRREKLRAERSKRPLSMALYRLNTEIDTTNGNDEISALLDVLHQVSRETDIVGMANNSTIAVLCPDTDETGVQIFARKVETLTGSYWGAAETATYPDQVFDDLAEVHRRSPEIRDFLASGLASDGRHGYRLKRLLDVVGALFALVLLAPLMLVVAIVIAATSPGPVLFKQMRVGRQGALFKCYKFRSMVADVDDEIHRKFVAALIKGENEKLEQPETQTQVYKIQADPRVTWIGHIIRKTSIDELPQLFNVLKGEMSLVGPRPPIPYEIENYQAWHLRRILKAMPGITGLWQVEGRSLVGFDDMVRLDLHYIRKCSLILDLKILLKTIAVVIRCNGAV